MTPSSAQSQLRAPLSRADMARLISLLPKPCPCPVGLATGGPSQPPPLLGKTLAHGMFGRETLV